MKPMQALTATEIDELDDFLQSDDTPDNCMDISALDGFLTALILNPDVIMPSEYLPWVWDMEEGEDAPSFTSVDHANHITQLVMRYYNSVLDAIANDNFSPLFYILEDDSYDAQSWSEGFMRGVYLFSEPWLEIFEKHHALIAPMVLLGTQSGQEMLETRSDSQLAIQQAYESIADTVGLLDAYFRELRESLDGTPPTVH
ncbi:MAG: YecA family protein [Proteobacteria bacterium]|nr:YecA family protein [Pseudomonadota bacterium]